MSVSGEGVSAPVLRPVESRVGEQCGSCSDTLPPFRKHPENPPQNSKAPKKGSTTSHWPLWDLTHASTRRACFGQNQLCPPCLTAVHQQTSVGVKCVCPVVWRPLQGRVEHGVGFCVLCGASCSTVPTWPSAPDAWLGPGCHALPG